MAFALFQDIFSIYIKIKHFDGITFVKQFRDKHRSYIAGSTRNKYIA